MVDAIKDKRSEVLRILDVRGARNPHVFGSFARGEARPTSDLDMLVDMEPGRSLLGLIGLEQDLCDLLGRRVDVATELGISPYLRERIFAEAVSL